MSRKDQAENDMANIDFALSMSKQKLEFQSKVTQALDTKTGIFIGFSGVTAVNVLQIIITNPSIIGLNVFTLGLLGLGYTFWCLVNSARARMYLDPPTFDQFYTKKALALPNIDLKNKATADMKKSYEHNHGVDDTRAKHFTKGIWSLFASVTLLIVGVIL